MGIPAGTAKDKAGAHGSDKNWPLPQRVYERILKRYLEANDYRAQSVPSLHFHRQLLNGLQTVSTW